MTEGYEFAKFLGQQYGFSGLVGAFAIVALVYFGLRFMRMLEAMVQQWPKVVNESTLALQGLGEKIERGFKDAEQVRRQQHEDLVRALERRPRD